MTTLRLKEVCLKIGFSTAHLYRLLDPKSKYFNPLFPRPKQVGQRRVLWLAQDIDNYLQQLSATVPSNQQSNRMKEIQKNNSEKSKAI